MSEHKHMDRSAPELLGDLAEQISTLISKEFKLARAEITEKTAHVKRGAAMTGAGAALGTAGATLIAAGAAFALAEIAPLWLAAIIVGLITLAIAYACISQGSSQMTPDLRPEKTERTMKENVSMAKEHL